MATPAVRRSALQFALDVTGGREVVYRVAAYLQELVRQLSAAPGLLNHARIDLLLFDAQSAQMVAPDRLLDAVAAMAATSTPGARFAPVFRQLQQLPFEGGGFHTFLLLTSNPSEGWAGDVTALQQLVASVTGLCCGAACPPDVALALSKEPGGTRVVNPLDTIRHQFDSIAVWLIENFAERVVPPVSPPSAVATPIRAGDLPPEKQADDPAPMPPPGAKWRVQEPTDRRDPVAHLASEQMSGVDGWRMLGASRRGKLHAHNGVYREDAFALGMQQGWHLIAVADGAGSCALSRVGAQVATQAAISGMTMGFNRHILTMTEANTEAALQQVICAGIEAAHAAVYTEADRRGIPVRDLSSTLLLLAFGHATAAQPYLAVGQIGDGLVLAVNPPDGSLQVFGAAEKGYYAGETVFLPMVAASEWGQHAWAMPLAKLPEMVLVMTDGVADDLVPLQRQAPTLIQGVRESLRQTQPAQSMLEMLAYEKRDSADDRTLAVLYHR